MNLILEHLKANKTFAFRSVTWMAVHPTLAPSVGVIAITESISPTSKKYVSRYAILELSNPDGRQFKVTKSGGDEIYYVLLTPVRADQCTCLGFENGGYCKHSEALRVLLDRRRLAAVPGVMVPLRTFAHDLFNTHTI